MMPGADLFPGDSIQITEESVANIVLSGSSVLVEPNALVKFMGNAVDSPMGVLVATSGEWRYGLTITPGAPKQSKFEMAEYEDSVIVVVRKGQRERGRWETEFDGSGRPGIKSQKEKRLEGRISGKTLVVVGGY
jgi:hypothetical protein